MKIRKKIDSGFDGRKSILDIYKCPKSKNGVRHLQKKRDFLICDHYALVLILRIFYL